MFLKQVREIDNIHLESLLTALVKETNSLTESQIEDVVFIENTIKQNSKIKLSKDASIKYKEFIEKVILFDDSLSEGIISNLFLGKPNPDKDALRYLDDKYKMSGGIDHYAKYISAISNNEDTNERNKDLKYLLKVAEEELKDAIAYEDDAKAEYKKQGAKYSENELEDYMKPSLARKRVQDIKKAMTK